MEINGVKKKDDKENIEKKVSPLEPPELLPVNETPSTNKVLELPSPPPEIEISKEKKVDKIPITVEKEELKPIPLKPTEEKAVLEPKKGEKKRLSEKELKPLPGKILKEEKEQKWEKKEASVEKVRERQQEKSAEELSSKGDITLKKLKNKMPVKEKKVIKGGGGEIKRREEAEPPGVKVQEMERKPILKKEVKPQTEVAPSLGEEVKKREEEIKKALPEIEKKTRIKTERFNISTLMSPLNKITEIFKTYKKKGEYQIKVPPKKLPKEMGNSLPPENWVLRREYNIREESKIQIYLNPDTSDYIYWVIEPALNEDELKKLKRIKRLLQISLPYSMEAVEENKREDYVLKHLDEVIKDYRIKLSENGMKKIRYYIARDFLGFGKVDSIMHDIRVEDVSCDGPGVPIYLYHRDYGSIKTNIVFEDDGDLDAFVMALAQKCHKTISVSNPILDSTLPNGSRLNATYGREITTRGSSFTIRRFREEPMTVVDMVDNNTLSDEMAAHLWLSIQYGESIIFAGGTASGKTTTMNAASIFIPPSSKIISIEDTREVNLPHENWIAGITRGGAESERPGDIGMYDLLRAALRQRPEYVIVGEVRGKETMTMFQAMATGHTTYSTMHADSVKSIVYRLENPPINIPRVLIQALNLVAIHKQMKVKDKRVRRITKMVEIVDIEPTTMEVVTNQVYRWNPRSDTFVYGGHSNLYEKIMDLEDISRDEILSERDRRAEIIRWMVKNNVRKFWDVARVVSSYYENPEKTIDAIRLHGKVEGNPLEIFEKKKVVNRGKPNDMVKAAT